MQLYVNTAATTSRAVLAFCHAASVALEIKHVDIMRGEQHAPAFTALNPNRLVPVLVDDGFVLTESSAILRYLACRAQSPLYPDDLQTRARIDERMAWFEANFFKDFGYQYVYPQFLPHHARSSPEGTRSAIEWGRIKSRAWLQVLDEHLLGDGAGWLVGGALSIADFFGAAILSLGELVGCRLDDYPNVQRWYAQVSELPSWRGVNGTFRDFAGSLSVREFVRL